MVDEVGKKLHDHNETIVQCILLLREQRDELAYIIDKQYIEREKLETEMERLTYKLSLINRSLAQRIHAKESYDKTISEIQEKYDELVKNSGDLALVVQKECKQLDTMINKTTSTEDNEGTENTITATHQPSPNSQSPCSRTENNCKCDPVVMPILRHQVMPNEVEFPTKLEKDGSESPGGSNTSSEKRIALGSYEDNENQLSVDQNSNVKDDDSEEGHHYVLNYRKYS